MHHHTPKCHDVCVCKMARNDVFPCISAFQESAAAAAAPQYSIIVPTFNEFDNIAVLVWLLHEALETVKDGYRFEVIVVDDNSSDATQDVVRGLQAWRRQQSRSASTDIKLVARPGKMGLGSAYAAGLKHACGDFVILMDADLSHHPKYLPAFIARQRATGCDVVTGTRYAAKGGVAGWSLARKLTSRGANLLASVALGARTSDLTGSFRLYRRDCLAKLLASTVSK